MDEMAKVKDPERMIELTYEQYHHLLRATFKYEMLLAAVLNAMTTGYGRDFSFSDRKIEDVLKVLEPYDVSRRLAELERDGEEE